MGAPRAAGGGPTRRTVLLTAVTTAVGVATARVLGVRDLATGFVRRVARGDPMGMGFDDDAMDQAMDAVEAPASMASAPPEENAPAAVRTPAPAAPAKRGASAAPAASMAPAPAPLAPPRLALGLDWVSPLDAEKARVAHLLRRATFGATDAELDRAQTDGFARTVDGLLDTPTAEPAALAVAEAGGPVRAGDLQGWWLEWMVRSPTPFAEAMTLFWHGHFTSDYRKAQTVPMYRQNLTWRRSALRKLGDMLFQVTVDPAMLRYLDLATSTGRSPNENYARELMELFTMGIDAYGEDDVKAAAKGLAGWRLPLRNEDQRAGIFVRDRAYTGLLTFLGKTGSFDTRGILDRILEQEATASFIAGQVARYFVSPYAPRAYVARLAERFRASRYDVKALMRDVFTSPEFTAPEAYRALVKGPTEFMVSAAKALGAPTLAGAMVAAGQGLGQSLFDPPSVGGWPENDTWISSNTVLARANFVTAALGATRVLSPSSAAIDRHLDGVLGPETARELSTETDERKRWFAILASPEFQLK